jgi:hypothetical protein
MSGNHRVSVQKLMAMPMESFTIATILQELPICMWIVKRGRFTNGKEWAISGEIHLYKPPSVEEFNTEI